MFDAITATQLAMEFDQIKLQSISQNISNMNTPGFKKQLIGNTSFDAQVEASINQVMKPQWDQIQLKTQGTVNQTNHATDLAINGEGYFQVQWDQGIFYTRRGDFQINSQGELTTATGEIVLGQNGAIKVDDIHFTINSQGILFVNHHKLDQLNIVQLNQPNLLRYVGNGLYETEEMPIPANANTQVLQGFIEQSNVKSIDEMMDMIKTSRHFEANQRIMRIADNLLTTAINHLGEGSV